MIIVTEDKMWAKLSTEFLIELEAGFQSLKYGCGQKHEPILS